MPTISVSRKKIVGIIAAVLFLGLGILAIEALKISRPIPTPTPSVDDVQASAAVVAGVEAFFGTV